MQLLVPRLDLRQAPGEVWVRGKSTARKLSGDGLCEWEGERLPVER
ncbi:MAG: hypothetical protein IPM93_24515 [Candidatus Obscuribacter sp.]|nr:hypothetical protein [Candidatus Obscuribacter sp.]